MKPVRTTCPYCGVGCGVIATPDGAGGAKIEGDPAHPANFGRLCSKGTALGETLDLEGRLLAPQIGQREAGWDEALDLVADKFSSAIKEHGADSVAFYVSGQLLTEDYYVANKLMKGYIGSANIDTNSRLCMASSVAGHKRAFGTDTVPGTYEDFEDADLVVLVGSNLAWCHPVLHQRLMAAKETRDLTVVNIDPRRTATAEMADIHLAIKPGADLQLFNGLLTHIVENNAVDADYVKNHVSGFEAAVEAAKSERDLAEACGLPREQLDTFLKLWTGTKKVVTVYSQGVNQTTSGTDKVNAIINCHLATGRIGQAGMGPFSVTGQPNAMGGREVGGLANMLASHLEIANPEHRAAVQTFWDSPRIADHMGLKAVDLFNACAEGKIKALWIMGTNPAVSLPRADYVREAIKNCEFVVVSDPVKTTETTVLADVLLPVNAWGEKGGTVTNSERRISRQRVFLEPPTIAKPDWEVLSDVARRMGFTEGFDYSNPAEIFDEYARLCAVAAHQGVDLDLSGLAGLSAEAYNDLSPTQWPVSTTRTGGRFFADGRFYTENGRANMLAVTPRMSPSQPSAAYPLLLNTGRIRDQWHTMTRSGKSATLSQHCAEPFVEIHPKDAEKLGISTPDIVAVNSADGHMIARALVTDRTQKGHVFAPMHWSGPWAANGRATSLVAANTDPISGQPESKRSAVSVQKFQAGWFGFAVSVEEPTFSSGYWAKARCQSGWRAELAGLVKPDDWEGFARQVFGAPEAEAVIMSDAGNGAARIALLADSKVIAALYISREPVPVARSFLVDALAEDPSLYSILAGRLSVDQPDPGATVCSCFSVGVNTVVDAIKTQNLRSLDEIGAALHAGTNCGSCRPELGSLLKSVYSQPSPA